MALPKKLITFMLDWHKHVVGLFLIEYLLRLPLVSHIVLYPCPFVLIPVLVLQYCSCLNGRVKLETSSMANVSMANVAR